MDIHMHGNPRLHYGHNGYHQSPHSKEDGMQFLSVEEKECILFFEETIDSLEEGLEEEGSGLSSERKANVENLRTAPPPAVRSASPTAIDPNLIGHDIIDLVHSTSDFTMPDFPPPPAFFDVKPTINPMESISPTATGYDAYEDSSHQPPPPTLSPLVMPQPRQSLESPTSPSHKSGPPTHAKPHRLPENINLMLGSREPTHLSIATEAVNMQERRSQMLANLPPSAHPLEGGEPACVRNFPTRSVSFKDPVMDKSRMEALSMLGLAQAKTLPANMAPVTGTKTQSSSSTHSANYKTGSSAEITSSRAYTSSNTGSNANTSPNTTVSQRTSSPYKVSSSAYSHNSPVNNVSPNTTVRQRRNSGTIVTDSSTSSYEPKAKSEISSNFNIYGGKSAVITPASTDSSANPAKQDRRPSTGPVSAEVTHSDFNSFGGKTVMLSPTASFKGEPIPSASSPVVRPEPPEVHINSFGGKSRVINPAAQTDQPDGPACRPRSNSSSPSSTITASALRTDLNSPTGSKSRIFPPAKADAQHGGLHYSSTDQPDLNNHEAKPKAVSPLHPDPVYQPTGRSKSATLPPPPAPKPLRSTGSLRPRPEPVPQEIRSKPPPKPSFRSQGITVQFSGKGATDEARRDALRKLGLLKNTS